MAEVTAFRNNALPFPIYGQPFTITFPILDADGDPVTGATAPDTEISKNGDTFTDCTNEVVEIATTSGIYYIILTGTELTCDIATIRAQTTSTGAKTTVATLYPRKLVTLRSGTCQAGSSSTTIVLDASASAVDNYYNGCACSTTLTGATEVRMISGYVGSTKTATIEGPAWNVTPTSSSTFIVKMTEGSQIMGADIKAWLGTTVATPTVAGVPSVSLTHLLGTAISGTAANIAGAFTKFFDKATPTGTINSLPDVVPGSAGAVFIAGANTATSIGTTGLTATFTGNLTGNVAGSVASVNGLTASNLDAAVSSRLAPTVASRTLDVSVTGEAGVDWANVGSPTTTVGLSGTTVGTATAVGTVNALAANVITAAATATDFGTEVAAATTGAAGTAITTLPSETASTASKIDWIFSWFRNRQTMNRSTGVVNLYRDDGTTVAGTMTVNDDGTTFTRPELT